MEVLQRPGGELATRPIHFFWVVDCSGSMHGEKIGIVNNTIQECIPEMRSAADNNPNAQLLIRALQFHQEQVDYIKSSASRGLRLGGYGCQWTDRTWKSI